MALQWVSALRRVPTTAATIPTGTATAPTTTAQPWRGAFTMAGAIESSGSIPATITEFSARRMPTAPDYLAPLSFCRATAGLFGPPEHLFDGLHNGHLWIGDAEIPKLLVLSRKALRIDNSVAALAIVEAA